MKKEKDLEEALNDLWREIDNVYHLKKIATWCVNNIAKFLNKVGIK